MKYNIFYLAVLFLIACGSNDSKSNSGKSDHANSHMNSSNFNELVEKFDSETRKSWQKPDLVIEKMGAISGKKIIDIGAGSGYFSFKLAEQGAEVIALDVDQRFLDHIESKKGNMLITTKLSPKNDPRIEVESADMALTVNTYHHIADRIDYFYRVHNGLKPDGKLVVVDFKKVKTQHGPPVEMRVDGLTVLKELKRAGFRKVIIDISSLEEQYIVTAKK